MARTCFSRRGFSLSILSLLVGIALSPRARAQSLTTLFAGNNGATSGGLVFFDLNVFPILGLTVTDIAINTITTVGTPINVEIYTRSGTSVGFEGNASGWTLVSSGSGTAAAVNTPSLMNVTDFALGSGVTGMAVRNIGYTSQYTNGTGSNEFYSNVDLSLSAGSATNGTFVGGGVFTPRVWNGTLFYTGGFVGPEPGTLALLALGIVGGIVARRRK
ncbi:PEP-CTERM sorting domain-containing protein [Armatimonas sp.]|uniref:PEP-CTERM sorting domain-containing protein n=1 Tax=Armatimonas sp. TaxID=1872638 RepID=UPI003752C794